jgi:hypothetical protein
MKVASVCAWGYFEKLPLIARIVELQGWGRGWCKKVLLNLKLKTIKFQLTDFEQPLQTVNNN